MNNQQAIARLDKELILREATNDIKLETSNCNTCGFNHYSNIGTYICAKCGNNK